MPATLEFGLRVVRWVTGPVGQQLLALAVIAFGVVTFVTIAEVNSGALMVAWSRLLVFLFGWGAYPLAALIVALGLLWLRHLVHRATTWRWRPFLGLELTLIGLLTLTHTFISQHGWRLVELGRGGGVIGWALYVFFSGYFGPLITGFLMFLVTLLGIGLAFDLTVDDLRMFGQRVAELWAAMRAARESAEEPFPSQEPAAPATRPAPAASTSASSEPQQLPLKTSAKPRPAAAAKPASRPRRKSKAPPPRDGELPSLDLLKHTSQTGMDQAEIKRKSRIIEQTLAQFGVPAKVTEVRPGPTVTQFGVSPGYIDRKNSDTQRKVRVSQIASLSNDLALALAASSLRIQAPVPGRAVVGVEVPNAEINIVSLRAVLESEEFAKCAKPLCFTLGLDVAGGPVVADLSTMPHLLIAGTTGSGKSVFVKALAASLMMNNDPESLRLITIDPKIVELSHLNGLPHLLGSTETDLDEIIRVLRWVAHEMDERYKRFATAVARNIDDYNRKAARKDDVDPMPRIVVLIDELADLMMAAPDETERTLTRIAQMARATGIHLVVATQRPSTDVVTGLIKANFPARVSFATTSSTDSRVIIDTPGAESLLGRGDMLFLPPDASAPLRVQGCFISDNELEAIINFWQKRAGATPAKAPWTIIAESDGPASLRLEGEFEDADLLERAIALAQNRGKITSSGLQRRLRISYPRAARLMEEMEKMGVVGPQESAGRKRRVILGGEEES